MGYFSCSSWSSIASSKTKKSCREWQLFLLVFYFFTFLGGVAFLAGITFFLELFSPEQFSVELSSLERPAISVHLLFASAGYRQGLLCVSSPYRPSSVPYRLCCRH